VNLSKSAFTKKLFYRGFNAKLRGLDSAGRTGHVVWDLLLFHKLKASLGLDRVRILLSGGAPLSAVTMKFYRILLGPDCTCHEVLSSCLALPPVLSLPRFPFHYLILYCLVLSSCSRDPLASTCNSVLCLKRFLSHSLCSRCLHSQYIHMF